jgi:hypothetical protein
MFSSLTLLIFAKAALSLHTLAEREITGLWGFLVGLF